jgi:hypothetical protein
MTTTTAKWDHFTRLDLKLVAVPPTGKNKWPMWIYQFSDYVKDANTSLEIVLHIVANSVSA